MTKVTFSGRKAITGTIRAYPANHTPSTWGAVLDRDHIARLNTPMASAVLRALELKIKEVK